MEKSCKTSHSVHNGTVAQKIPSEGSGPLSTGKSKAVVNTLKSATMQRPDSCKTRCKFLPRRDDDTNASVGYTSSGTQAARRGKCSN